MTEDGTGGAGDIGEEDIAAEEGLENFFRIFSFGGSVGDMRHTAFIGTCGAIDIVEKFVRCGEVVSEEFGDPGNIDPMIGFDHMFEVHVE